MKDINVTFAVKRFRYIDIF